jgi:hypothetical protein
MAKIYGMPCGPSRVRSNRGGKIPLTQPAKLALHSVQLSIGLALASFGNACDQGNQLKQVNHAER